mgnify:CR=1 FL=1
MAAATDERLIYEILSAVGEIPEGNVATYGQIAVSYTHLTLPTKA